MVVRRRRFFLLTVAASPSYLDSELYVARRLGNAVSTEACISSFNVVPCCRYCFEATAQAVGASTPTSFAGTSFCVRSFLESFLIGCLQEALCYLRAGTSSVLSASDPFESCGSLLAKSVGSVVDGVFPVASRTSVASMICSCRLSSWCFVRCRSLLA